MSKKVEQSYILEFLSGKYEGGKYPLNGSEEVRIGRSSELELVLVEDMVSRKHARISVEEDAIKIEDIGSTNGTFVNGDRIDGPRALEKGDRILIGSNVIKLISKSDEIPDNSRRSTAEIPEEDPPGTREEQTDVGRTGSATVSGSISGFLEEVPLEELFQLLESTRKSGILVVTREFDRGEIFLDEGEVYYAQLNNDAEVPPEKAFHRIFRWETGRFALEKPGDPPEVEERLETPLDDLIDEALRQKEKLAQLGDDIPDLESHLELETPLVPPLRSLEEDQLDAIQLVHNYGRVRDVLNQSLMRDFETLKNIVYLIRQDYVRVE